MKKILSKHQVRKSLFMQLQDQLINYQVKSIPNQNNSLKLSFQFGFFSQYYPNSEHIHTLSQEALDHADLTVLTAVIGASALIKNCLWVYLRSVTEDWCPPRGDEKGGSLKVFSYVHIRCYSSSFYSDKLKYALILDRVQTVQ